MLQHSLQLLLHQVWHSRREATVKRLFYNIADEATIYPLNQRAKMGRYGGDFLTKLRGIAPFRPPTTYLNKKRQEPHKIEKQRPPPLLRPFEGQYAFSKDIAVRLLYDTRLHDTIPVLACTDEIKSEPRDIIRDDGVILHHTF